MGNSCWDHCVPYHDDIFQALQQLRRQVFAEKRYYKGLAYAAGEEPASLEQLVLRTGYRTHSVLDVAYFVTEVIEPEEPPSGQLALFDVPRTLPPSPEYRQLDRLPGGARAHGGAIHPLSKRERIALFGTARPTIAAGTCFDQVLHSLSKWVYVVLYEEDCPPYRNALPDQILFVGCSGGG